MIANSATTTDGMLRRRRGPIAGIVIIEAKLPRPRYSSLTAAGVWSIYAFPEEKRK